jgi:hypothetical protein
LFSIAFSWTAAVLGTIPFLITKVYVPEKQLEDQNEKTLGRINCDADTCNVSEIANDWEFNGANYILDKQTFFVLSIEPPAGDFSRFHLHRSDPAFIQRFHTPKTVESPAGESWRLFSDVKQVGDKNVAIMVGYAAKASWKMDLPFPPESAIDTQLKEQLLKIEASIREDDGIVEVPAAARKITVDGYEVVDLTSDAILSGGFWIPVYFPRSKALPREGISFYKDKYDLYLLRTDANERLLATSAELIGDVRALAAVFALLLSAFGVVSYVSGATFLRRYLLFQEVRPQTVQEALKLGEGINVEFKRSISFEMPGSFDQILQTIVAFANTGDGTVFIGIEDNGNVRGIKLATSQEKDRLSQRIHQVVRHRIKPSPLIQVDFVDVRDIIVCRVFVPRGDDPLYFLDGVIYVRGGPTDIKAQPEIVRRLLAAHAF